MPAWPTIRSGTRTPSSTRCTSAASSTATTTASATSPGLTQQARLHPVARRQRALAAAVLPVAAARRRLRHRALRGRAPALRHAEGLPGVPRRRARARPARHHRARHQSHVRPAPVVPGGAAGAARDRRKRNFYVWSDTRQEVRRRPRSSSATPSDRTGPGIRSRASTTGTGSSHHQPDLNFDNPHGAQGRAAGDALLARPWASTACGSTPCRTSSSAKARRARTCRRRTTCCASCAREMDARYPNRMLLAEANLWPSDVRRVLRRRRRMPHGVPLPADAAPVHGAAAGGPASDQRNPVRRRRTFRTTCQWAIFLRNHDELTLEMVTDEERDYMYQAYAADPQMRVNAGIRRRLAPLMENSRRAHRAAARAAAVAAGHAGASTTATRSAWATTSTSGDRNGVRTPMQWTRRSQRRLLARRSGAALRAGRSWIRSTATRPSTSRRRSARRSRCSTGCAA